MWQKMDDGRNCTYYKLLSAGVTEKHTNRVIILLDKLANELENRITRALIFCDFRILKEEVVGPCDHPEANFHLRKKKEKENRT